MNLATKQKETENLFLTVLLSIIFSTIFLLHPI